MFYYYIFLLLLFSLLFVPTVCVRGLCKLLICHCHCQLWLGRMCCAFILCVLRMGIHDVICGIVEKPSGDVTGGSNKYDYRPSSTLASQRRKYPVPLIVIVHLFNQKYSAHHIYTRTPHTFTCYEGKDELILCAFHV